MKLFKKELFSTENLERIKKEYNCRIRKLPKAGGYRFELEDNSVLYLRNKKQSESYVFKYTSKDDHKEFNLTLFKHEIFEISPESEEKMANVSLRLLQKQFSNIGTALTEFTDSFSPMEGTTTLCNAIIYKSIIYKPREGGYLTHSLSNIPDEFFDDSDEYLETTIFVNKDLDFVAVFNNIEDMNKVIETTKNEFMYNNVELIVPTEKHIKDDNTSDILDLYLKEFLY